MLALFRVPFHLYLQELTIGIVEDISHPFPILEAAPPGNSLEENIDTATHGPRPASKPCGDESRSAPINTRHSTLLNTRHSTLRIRSIATPPVLLTVILEPQGLCPGFIRRQVRPSPPFAPGPRPRRP